MGDFFQCGRIATLHQISSVRLDRLEDELRHYVRFKPVSLILPCQYSELSGTALPRIVDHLKGADYLRRIVVTLDGAGREGYRKTKDFFSSLPQETVIIWNSAPSMEAFYTRLWTEGLVDTASGRGRSLWMATGYLLARRDTDVIAVHDSDILTYERSLLARLIYPLVHPSMEYEFTKGYYARVTNRLHGRVMRLFVIPVIRALKATVGALPYLDYLDSFRYPISGEFAGCSELMRVSRMPATWGLEIGMLEEVYRNCAQRRICQVDLSIEYEHVHLELSDKDPSKGLHKMCIDIACTLFHALASEGISFSKATFRSLKVAYQLIAQDMIRFYEDDAAINGLLFDRHSEEIAVETFTKGFDIAVMEFLEDPLVVHFIPSWSRASSALPGITSELVDIVESPEV
ncbi:MAG TPA: glycosyl transferase [Desulfomonilia bacterium]|jgi:glucosyl-3-phosphoglycerate synthase|nr:glycosyl transferase [Thermodesulfobacteriota bacterium]HWR68070.1 glycosyl transferase [Desulfomonilia bacterium]